MPLLIWRCRGPEIQNPKGERGHGGEPLPVVLKIRRAAVRAMSETSWHPSQQIESQPDGSILLRLTVAITPDLIGWILSIGADAIALQPAELVDAVQQRAAAILALYPRVAESQRNE